MCTACSRLLQIEPERNNERINPFVYRVSVYIVLVSGYMCSTSAVVIGKCCRNENMTTAAILSTNGHQNMSEERCNFGNKEISQVHVPQCLLVK